MTIEAQTKTILGPGGQQLQVMLGRELPHSLEAEERLMAGVLADDTGAAWAVAVNCGLRAKAFYQPAAQVAWAVLGELRQGGQPGVDVGLLAEELKVRGQLDQVGGYAWLAQVSKTQPTSLNVRYYAEMVVLLWEMRTAVTLADKLREAALEFESREKFAAKAAEVGGRLIGLGRKTAQKSMEEKTAEAKEDVLALAEGRADKSRWVPTGLAQFDEECKPFGAGGADDRFIVIAGGSGHGKSVALRNVARASLKAGQRVLAYVRETGVHGFVKMMAAAETGFDLDQADVELRDRQASFAAEMDRMSAEWANRKLFCIENEAATPLTTIEDLAEHARAWCHLHGAPELILVDYLQIFDSRRRMPSNEARVAYVSHALQALQRELGCVVVVAAQLNESGLNEMRKVQHDGEGKLIHRLPHRGDLRESQAIYHDADRVIFLYVPPENSAGMSQLEPGLTRLEVWWYQEKRRAGRTRKVKTTFEKNYVRFVGWNNKAPVATAKPSGAGSAGETPKAAGKGKFLQGGKEF